MVGEQFLYGTVLPPFLWPIIVKGFEQFEKDSIILLEQIRTIDKKRLQEYIGTFSSCNMVQTYTNTLYRGG